MHKKKAQASLEFIYTYGWALAALLVVVAVLAQFDVFNPNNFLNDYCSTGDQIRCLDADLVSPDDSSGSDNATFYIALRNTHQVDIMLQNITIFLDNNEFVNDTSQLIPAGDNITKSMDLTGYIFEEGSKQQSQIDVVYSRAGGANNYTVRGSVLTTVRLLR